MYYCLANMKMYHKRGLLFCIVTKISSSYADKQMGLRNTPAVLCKQPMLYRCVAVT